MNGFKNNKTNNEQTAMGSLVTDGRHTTLDPDGFAMGLVSDNGSDVSKPVTTWIFSFLTALVLVTFLSISFYRYHKRYREKRDREYEYFRKVKELHPDCQFNDFKVSRARSVMTNTHNTFPNLDKLEFGVGPPLGRRLFKSFPPSTPNRNPRRQSTRVDIHGHPPPNFGYGNDGTADLYHTKDSGSEHSSLNVPYMDDYVDDSESDNMPAPVIKTVSKKSGVKRFYKSKIRVSGKRKKKGNVLKARAFSQDDDFIEITNYESPYLSDFFLHSQRTTGDPRLAVTRHVKSDSDLHAFASEELQPREMTTFDLNEYYLEAGIAKPQSYLQKRRTSSVISIESSKGSNKPNAFYDRLVLREKPRGEYEELVHRNSEGNVNFKSRALPCLETEYHENQSRKLHNERPTTNSVDADPVSVNSGNSSRRSSDPLISVVPKGCEHNTREQDATELKETIPLRDRSETIEDTDRKTSTNRTKEHTTKL